MSKLLFDHHPDDLPEHYVMTCDGHCLEPEIMHGQKLWFSRTEPYKPGDFVLIFKMREFTAPGDHQILIKKLIAAPKPSFWRDGSGHNGNVEPGVVAEMLNPAQALWFPATMILGVHKCVGPVPAHMKTYKVDDEWIRGQAAERRQECA